jgi:hypothetical protein
VARTFDGAADEIQVGIGGCNLTGAFTVVVVMRRNSAGASYHALCTPHTSANAAVYGLEIENNSDGNQLQVQVGGTFVASTFTVGTADSWVLLAGGKAAGTTTPRVHKYVYNTNTWTHQNASGTAGNPTSTAGGTVRFGRWQNTDDLDGDLAAAAIFDRLLTDAEVEQLAHSLQGWLAAAPVGMWVFDQQSTGTAVNDWTGNGAQQSSLSGTAVAASSVIGLSYGHDVVLATSAPAGGTVESIDADLTVTATTTATAATDKPVTAAVAATAAAAATASVVKPAAAALAATATLSGSATSVKPVDATRATTAALSAAAAATKPVDATLTGTATLSAAGTSTKPVAAAVPVTASVTAAASVTTAGKDIDADVITTATVSPAAATTKPVDSTLTGTASLTGTAASTKPVDAARASIATLTATAATTKPVDAARANTAAITATAASTKPVAAALAAAATISADAVVGTPPKLADAAPTFTATLTATGQGIRPATAGLPAVATITADVVCIRGVQASLPIAADLFTTAFIGVEVIGMDQGSTTVSTLAGDATHASTGDMALVTASTLG